MCDKWKYTFIFWDLRNQGAKYQIKDPILEEMLEDMIQNSNERFTQLKKEQKIDTEKGRCYITGTFTNWQPRRMLQIDELCAYLQKKDDALQNVDRREFYHGTIKDKWRSVLKNHTQYPGDGTQYVAYPDPDDYLNRPPELDYDQLYVYCDFIKPGKHSYIVSY